jgi:uncharacterized protein (TIGR02147 family)
MLRIFDYHDYKAFVIAKQRAASKGGRGEFQKISKACKMHPTLVSQVFRGDRDLSLEQAYDLCAHLVLDERETDYFIRLVSYARCGTERAKRFMRVQIDRIREDAAQEASRVDARVKARKILKDEERAIFYSSWVYSAVRNASALPDCPSVESIAERLHLPNRLVEQVVRFLLENGLCVEKDGRLTWGPQSTHLSSESPLVSRHHANWRTRGLERMDRVDRSRELFFTSPMSLSADDVVWVRTQLLDLIEVLSKRVKDSPSETLACLNIDWFGF